MEAMQEQARGPVVGVGSAQVEGRVVAGELEPKLELLAPEEEWALA